MAEPLPSPSLSRAREVKIDELSRHFANDDLSLEDLERRIERVYKASSLAELETITADLTLMSPTGVRNAAASPDDGVARVARGSGDPANQPLPVALRGQRMLAIMSSTRRVGPWTVPRDLRVVALMSDTKLDLTKAMLPTGGIVNMHVTAMMASFRLIVSPDVQVINDMHSIMADVGGNADDLPVRAASGPKPVIRLTGTAFMAEVKVKVRRREDPLPTDDD